MAIYVYKTTDGALVSWCPNDGDPVAPDAELAAKGLAKIAGLAALDDTHGWDAATHSVVAIVPRKPVVTVLAFWQRFTAAEREALQNAFLTGTQAVKNAIGAFRDYLVAGGSVDLNDGYVQTKVTQMETAGVLAAGRAAQILE